MRLSPLVLYAVAFADEQQGGGPMVASPALVDELSLSRASLAGVVFTLPWLAGALLEPAVLLLSARLSRRWLLAAALAVMGAGQVAVALAPSAVALTAAISVWGIGSGIATALTEVALVAGSTHGARTMTRWALAGAIGDLAAPLLYAALAGAWRPLALLSGALALSHATLVALGPPLGGEDDEPPSGEGEGEGEGHGRPLRRLLTNGPLWGWLGLALACTLFDEIFVAFGGLWLEARGLDAAGIGMVFAAFSTGAALANLVVDRALARFSDLRLLGVSSIVLGGVFLAFLAGAPALPLAVVLGGAAAPMWPLVTARAYAAGGRPEAVAALERLFAPVELVLPLLLGLLADARGLDLALAALLLQPLVVGLGAAWARAVRPPVSPAPPAEPRARPGSPGGPGAAPPAA